MQWNPGLTYNKGNDQADKLAKEETTKDMRDKPCNNDKLKQSNKKLQGQLYRLAELCSKK